MTDVVYPTAPPLEQDAGLSEPPPGLPPPPPEGRRRPVASMWTRAAELVIEVVLIVCTFGFGWVGWWIIAWADGQSPAKVVLRMHVVAAGDGQLASFGRMAVREALGKGVAGAVALAGLYNGQIGLVSFALVYVLIGVGFGVTDNRRRTVWDLIAGTVVLDGDPPLPVFATPAEADTSPL
jgi:hypothetical protein